MNALVANWRSRGDAERSRIAAIAALAALIALFALAWLPMRRESARLEAGLPAMRAATATMKRQADLVTALRAAPPRSAATPQPLASLAGSGALAQALPGAQVTALDERRLRVAAGDLAWGTLLEWIATAKAQHGLDVTRARIEALAMTGRVKAELTLERP